jgi:hypothetical protein
LIFLGLTRPQAWPARVERLLHVRVRSGDVATPLEDLGIDAVALEQLFTLSLLF